MLLVSAAATALIAGLSGTAVAAPRALASHAGPGGHGERAHRHRGPRPVAWTLFIPGIGVKAPVIGLSGPRYGRIRVPSFAQVLDVGWYRYGAVPGNRGNALLLGHVDTYAGPAVFYNLYRLVRGNTIWVNLGHHGSRRFTVRSVAEIPKRAFPAAAVFGDTTGRHLWLVTCGGTFDYTTRSYRDNIIVLATAWQPPHRKPHRKPRHGPHPAPAARGRNPAPAARGRNVLAVTSITF